MNKVIARIALAFLAVGIVLLGVAGVQASRTSAFLGRASAVPGKVVALTGTDTAHAVVRFQTADGASRTIRSAVGSSPPAFEVGEEVVVLYDPAAPSDARISAFSEQWFLAVFLASFGVVFASIGGGILGVRAVAARGAEQLRRTGARVQARFQSVELNRALDVNGRHPWRIVCQWQNPSTGELHLFHSQNLWFDPTPFVVGRGELTVFVDRRNPRRHHVDVSFLPRLAA